MRILSFICLICLFAFPTKAQICSKSQLPTNLQNGLVAFYPFCGNANDASGNGNNGTANNITFGVDRFGTQNSTGVFTKANSSYFFYPAAQQFQPTSFTLSTWFNTNIIQSGGLGSEKDQFIAGYSPNSWASGPSYSHSLGVTNNSKFSSRMWTRSTSWEDILTTSGTIKPNEWYNAITTYDITTGSHRFYINGVLYGERISKIEYFNQSGFYIGASRQNLAGTINTFFDGKIDDVGFWNRALSPCEVTQLFNSTNNTFPALKSPTINSLPDTTSLCGTSKTLDAGAGFTSYLWNTGETTQSITHNTSGKYSITVSDASGCTATDSTYLSLVNAKIIQKDTSICIGSTMRLNIDSTLNAGSNKTVRWSNGSNFNAIKISPLTSTKYQVTVSDGISTCMDSVMITVVDTTGFNTLSDTTRVCGTSITLSTVTGFETYSWNTGATTASITPTNSGFYKITATKGGCSVSDSTYLSIVQAKILQRDTTICLGSSINLSIDSTTTGATFCNSSQFPTTLQNGLVGYFPFCGNANNASGKGNNGIVYGATLDTDRFNKLNSAYNFNGNGQFIDMGTLGMPNTPEDLTYSAWIKINKLEVGTSPFTTTTPRFIVISKRHFDNGPSYITFTVNPDSAILLQSDGFLIGQGTRAGNVFDGSWKMVTGIKRGNQLKVFIDGKPMDSIQINNTILSSSNNFHIGHHGAWGNFSNGKIDDVAIWNRALTNNEVSQLYRSQNVSWSTGATSNSITVSPSQTTKYYATVSNGTSSCVDSITVTVSDLGSFNSLQDTVRVCGDSATLDAGTGFAQYKWSNGAITQKIVVKSSGKYSVGVTNAAGCSASDSSLVSIVKAKILQRDTTICKGASITLNTDSSTIARASCNLTDIQTNLRNGLLGYWPFCNNLNDASGNGRHATNYGAVLAKDRFGNAGNAMGFSLSALSREYITVPGINVSGIGSTGMSLSQWYKRLPQSTNVSTLFRQEGACDFPDFLIQSRNTGIETGIRTTSYSSSFSNYTIDTNWHMISFTYDRAQLRTYLDGDLIATQARTGNVSFLENISYIGICGSVIDHQFAGYIDDIGIWNRPLSTQELTAMVNGNPNALIQRQWSTGASSSSITLAPTQTTKYYVTVSDGITSCKDSVTVTVAQLDTSIVALDPTSVCFTGGTVRLQAGLASAYQWLKDGAAINGANAQLLSATQTGSYRVVVTNANGCSDTSRAINIVLDPKPVANFTINSNAQCLTENGFIFTNTSTIASGTMTYAWSLGNGTTATSADASVSYTTAGTYNIKLVATSNRLCTDSITKSVTIYPQPAIPTITGADAFCTGASIVLNTDAPTPRQWYRNNVLVTNGSGTSLTIRQPGDYKVSTVNANGCTTFSAVKTISENPLPQGSLVTPTSAFICEGTPYTLTANGGASYQWFLNNVVIAGQTSATLNTSIAGNYKVEFVSDKGCRAMSTNSIDLTLIKAPDAAFSFDTYCVNVQTNFSSRSTTNQSGNVTYTWRFGDGRTAGNTINTSNTYTRTGSFTTTLRVTPNACPQLADSAQVVLVIQAPTPGIQYPPVNAIINKAQQLNARNIGNSYQWNPATFLSNSTSRTPSVTPTKEQLYRIIITNIAGCTTIDTQLVRVFADRNIYVPEGFSPDNDGRNDRLYPISVGINEIKVFRIYNRWGLLMYDNKNANANTGWDGNYKGTKQPMETYVWVAEGIDIDGNFIRRTGNSILVR